jgi:outer membrane protein OmpA-like peptidoglycan-associated protein
MKKLFYAFIIALAVLVSNSAEAQKRPIKNFDKKVKAYVGLRGGMPLFFKSQKELDYLNGFTVPAPNTNKGVTDTSVNTIWGLKGGYFVELGGGIKYKRFGWGLWLGYQELKRDKNINFMNTMQDLSARNIDIANPPAGYSIVAGPKDTSYVNNIKSLYLMTGPEYYIGKFPFFVQVHAYGGLAKHTDKGYGTQDTKMLMKTGGGFGAFEYLRVQSEGDRSTAGYQEEYRLSAKAGLNAEYFVQPKISLSAGADFNYTSIWNKTTFAYEYVDAITTNPINQKLANGTVSDRKRDLSYLSANIGVKYWFGKVATTKTKTTPKTVTVAPEPKKEIAKAAPKTVVVLVKDKCTGIVLPNVSVSLKNDEAKIATAYTDANGIAKFDNIEPQIVACSGVKNEVKANTSTIEKAQFATTETEIKVTLLHDDPRFTLIGNAVTESGADPIQDVTANISNLTSTANKTAITNDKGEFYEQLEQGSDFKIVGQAKNKFSAIKEVSTKGLDRCKDLYVRLEMPMEKVEIGKTVVLKNIYYDLNKSAIRIDAAKELDVLVDFLNTNRNVKVEIASHTDSRSQDSYNLKLSQKRADEAVAYLVTKGIDKSRLVAKGYGETKLVNNCSNGTKCSEADHQMNRRTEFKILGM